MLFLLHCTLAMVKMTHLSLDQTKILMVCVKKYPPAPTYSGKCILVKADLARIIELYFSKETCIVTKNTDNIVII